MRKGAYKAHFTSHDGYSKAPVEQHNPPLLFNLPEDPLERFDVASNPPEIIAELAMIYQEHTNTVTHGKLR